MEVRTVLVVLLSRFWFDLAPSMGRPEQVAANQQVRGARARAGGRERGGGGRLQAEWRAAGSSMGVWG